MKPPTLATIFSGIGIAEMAYKKVFNDLNIAFACEIDKFARINYETNIRKDQNYPFYNDIKDLNVKQYRNKIDILIGGSPCQDFSIAGARKGTEGNRGNLIWQYYRIIKECKPKIFIFENVKGFTSIEKGKSYTNFLSALRSLGYSCYTKILNTKDYNIPQNRERLYIIGFLDENQYYSFDILPPQPLQQTLASILETNVDEKYFLSEKAIKGFKKKDNNFQGSFDPKNSNDIANCLTTMAGNRRTDTFIKIAGNLNLNAKEHNKRVYSIDGIAPTLTAKSGGQTEPKILQRARGFNKGNKLDLCPTISSNSFAQNNPLEGDRIRKLTPRECLRLQGISDDFQIVVSDTQTYKQAGNAMSQNIVEMLLSQIKKAIENKSGFLLKSH